MHKEWNSKDGYGESRRLRAASVDERLEEYNTQIAYLGFVVVLVIGLLYVWNLVFGPKT
jgi:hypothetical protein